MLSTLYIPRINRTHMGHGEYIKKVFEHQGIAKVKSVEFFEHEIPSATFGYAIVKIQSWISGIISKHFQERIKDASKETRIVYSDPSYWIILPYTEKQKQPVVKIPPPPLTALYNTDSSFGCGEEPKCCSSQILYNSFTDKIWGNPDFSEKNIWEPNDILIKRHHSSNCRDSWNAMNSIEDNFRFYDTPFGFDCDTY